MQIRMRYGKAEFLRASWDATKGRSVQKLIKPEEFTAAEADQFSRWKAEKLAKAVTFENAHNARNLVQILNSAIAGIEGGQRPENPEQLVKAVDVLRNKMQRLGIKRATK